MAFAFGTQVTLGFGGTKNIEDLLVGDLVLGYSQINGENGVGVVEAISNNNRNHMGFLTFEDNRVLSMTKEHQVLTTLGWKSVDPDITFLEHPSARPDYSQPKSATNTLVPLQVGDAILTIENKVLKITDMRFVDGIVRTCNLRRISDFNIYFCNGLIVMSWGQEINEPYHRIS
jgi:hypothetical protein